MNKFENKIVNGDSLEELKKLPDNVFQCCVTSPPYWGLRDYGVDGQLGLEETPEEYISNMVDVFHEVKRVLKDDGVMWLNTGDSYCGYHGNKKKEYAMAPSNKNGYFENQRKSSVGSIGLKPKDLVGIPWMLAFALRTDGWYLRQDIIWNKPNPMPESVTDRCTKSHEYIFLLSKSQKYYYDQESIKEKASYNTHERKARKKIGPTDKINRIRPNTPKSNISSYGVKNNKSFDAAMEIMPEKRNKRSVWTVPTQPYSEAHFATYPENLIKPCILAGSKECDIIIDPFAGSGTTALAAQNLNRKYFGIELNPKSIRLCEKRLQQTRLEI